MRVCIAGSRDCTDYDTLLRAIGKFRGRVGEVVSGCCNGVDKMGEHWALEQGIPVKQFPPNWKLFGRAAGPIRNSQMVEYADAFVIVCKNGSRGATDLHKKFVAAGKPGVFWRLTDAGPPPDTR